MQRLLLLLTNPWCELAMGLVLVVTGGYEIVAELRGSDPAQLGAHHGVTLYGTMVVLRALAHGIEGVRKADNALVERFDIT